MVSCTYSLVPQAGGVCSSLHQEWGAHHYRLSYPSLHSLSFIGCAEAVDWPSVLLQEELLYMLVYPLSVGAGKLRVTTATILDCPLPLYLHIGQDMTAYLKEKKKTT